MRHPQDAATIPRISYPQDAPPILGCIFPRMVAAILYAHPRMRQIIPGWAALFADESWCSMLAEVCSAPRD